MRSSRASFMSLDLSQGILSAKYAVRGEILITANRIKDELKGEHNYPFNEIIYCNIGNPQRLMQTPLTYVRNVLSMTCSPQLLASEHLDKIFVKDEIKRAKGILGGYTHSQGLDFIRKEVSEFIFERDGKIGEKTPIDRIFLTSGASLGIQAVMSVLLRDSRDAVMIPIPQYPLYSASIALFGGRKVSYYLCEEKEWSVSLKELETVYNEAPDECDIRGLVVINPGNPTGQVLQKEDMIDIIKFCWKQGIVLFADEVYQENVYDESIKWYSFKRVMEEIGGNVAKELQLVSFHSVSKGFFGECGRRGGYCEFSRGWDESVIEQLYKKASITICPNIDGQIVTSIMVNPPKKGEESFELFTKERDIIIESLKRRSKLLTKELNSLEGVSCNPSKGALYAFPNIAIPKKAVKHAEANGMSPDLLYCKELLLETGVCVVPGSGFLQKSGTFHFRTTFLAQDKQFDKVVREFKRFHVLFTKKYS